MTKFIQAWMVVACMAALMVAAGCSDGGDGKQQAASSGAAPSAAAEKVTMKVASAFPLSLALLGDSAVTLTEKIDRVSGGSIELKMFEPGALVPALEAIQSVSKGSVEAAWSTAGYLAATDMAFNFFTAVPFGPDAP